MWKIVGPRCLIVTTGVLVAVSLIPSGNAGSVHAATPVPLPHTPDPSACRVAMPEPASLVAAIATPRGDEPGLPEVVQDAATLPQGEPAEAAVAAEVTATVGEFLACLNAGEAIRVYALVSDRFLRTRVVPNLPTQDALAALEEGFAVGVAASPVPQPEGARTTLVDVRDVRVLPDGAIGAVVVVENPTAEPPRDTSFFVLAREGDRLLIDAIVGIVPDPLATPTNP